jgi:hypothetical protein
MRCSLVAQCRDAPGDRAAAHPALLAATRRKRYRVPSLSEPMDAVTALCQLPGDVPVSGTRPVLEVIRRGVITALAIVTSPPPVAATVAD